MKTRRTRNLEVEEEAKYLINSIPKSKKQPNYDETINRSKNISTEYARKIKKHIQNYERTPALINLKEARPLKRKLKQLLEKLEECILIKDKIITLQEEIQEEAQLVYNILAKHQQKN